MLDKTTGSLLVGSNKVLLSPNMLIENFIKIPLYNGGNIGISYSVKNPQDIDGKTFIITIYFDNQKLKEIHLSEFFNGLSWDGWTEDNEIKKKKSHDEWLASILGEDPYMYSWGTVESVFDKKGCVSSIIIRYS